MILTRPLSEELSGVCRLPILVRSFMRPAASREVFERYRGEPLQGLTCRLEDGVVVGVRRDLLRGRDLLEVFAGAHCASLDKRHVHYSDTDLCGPLMLTNTHAYLVGMPRRAREDGSIVVYAWRFAETSTQGAT